MVFAVTFKLVATPEIEDSKEALLPATIPILCMLHVFLLRWASSDKVCDISEMYLMLLFVEALFIHAIEFHSSGLHVHASDYHQIVYECAQSYRQGS